MRARTPSRDPIGAVLRNRNSERVECTRRPTRRRNASSRGEASERAMELATREDLLTAYAAGTTSPGLSLLCAAHLTLSPEARAFVAGLEEWGGSMLAAEDDAGPTSAENQSPENLQPPSLEAMLALIDAAEQQGARPAETSAVDPARFGPLPAPVARAAGTPFDRIPWRFRLPGISEHVLPGFDGEKVSLLRGRPGARVLGHTHVGSEATLILTGEMKDGDRVLTRGDIALCGPEHDHHPEIIGDDICYCLIVVDGKLRFTGRFARALNFFGE